MKETYGEYVIINHDVFEIATCQTHVHRETHCETHANSRAASDLIVEMLERFVVLLWDQGPPSSPRADRNTVCGQRRTNNALMRLCIL